MTQTFFFLVFYCKIVSPLVITISIPGLFHIVRLPRLNSLVCHVPDSFDLAFKLRRKKMTIEVCLDQPALFVYCLSRLLLEIAKKENRFIR